MNSSSTPMTSKVGGKIKAAEIAAVIADETPVTASRETNKRTAQQALVEVDPLTPSTVVLALGDKLGAQVLHTQKLDLSNIAKNEVPTNSIIHCLFDEEHADQHLDKVVKPDWDYRLSPDYQLFLSQQHKHQLDQMCQAQEFPFDGFSPPFIGAGLSSNSSRESGQTSSHNSQISLESFAAPLVSVEVLEQLRIQAALGMVDALEEADLDFVKHVTLVVKLVEAKVAGGCTLYMFFFTEQNYHLKAYLERQLEIEGLGEYFAVPCKYFMRKTLAQELLKKKAELIKKGINIPLVIPSTIMLPFKNEKAGYMITYTHDPLVAAKIRKQIQFMCDSFKIPKDSKYNAGYAVRLQLDIVPLTFVNDVACIDALASIYREGRQ